MSTTNYDSSLLTQRRNAKALGAYARMINSAINNNAGVQTVRTTQPTTQMAIVVTEQNLGQCYCVQDARANPYAFNPSGGQCGC